jgi:subtilisin family serine protease
MERKKARKVEFYARIELLEDRRVMSADPLAALTVGAADIGHNDSLLTAQVGADQAPLEHHAQDAPDFWIDAEDAAALDDAFWQVEQALAQAHSQTGWYDVRSNYGFTGRGQTVAVIDSGIAYDHFALGGGFGANYRVVGGWDFSEENDGNPYDDGNAGGHGTHVSGIIGNSSASNSGVAPGVDFVGLRVFNDAGQGYFSWVENALRWVHQHRNSFENPITTVNLSLGVSSWNATTLPAWATLEDELAQLEADGIFIAVSAGNSFGSFNQPGLSYPAASQHVVPVMSTDDNGLLSSYSQRLGRAIAAPGRSITSTIPDYKGNHNGVADDFATMSGTSMAAPYLAGASVIIREAMEFVGRTNITQSMIYNHMMATADVIFDAATNLSYKRLDLQAAIDALMPADDYGSTLATAENLGALYGTAARSGAIGSLGDEDYFTFTAGSSGQATFEITSASGGMAASWQAYGSPGQPIAAADGGTLTISVVAGHNYTVRLASTGGLGHYSFEANLAAAFQFEDLGVVDFDRWTDLTVDGQRWFRVQASRDGLLTAQAFEGAGASVGVEIYDAGQQLVAGGPASTGEARADAVVSGGEYYFVRVTGNGGVDLHCTNLVSHTGAAVNVAGTAGDDAFSLAFGASHQLVVNGVSYSFAAGSASLFTIHGGGGSDSIVYFGSAESEEVIFRVGSATMSGAGYRAVATEVEYARAIGGGGADRAELYDTEGDDSFEAWAGRAQMAGAGYSAAVFNFQELSGHASSGRDRAVVHGAAGDDAFEMRPDRTHMTAGTSRSSAYGFDEVVAMAGGGLHQMNFYDSAGDDLYESWADRAVMSGAGYSLTALGFDQHYGYASTGDDQAILHDSIGDDVFKTWPTSAIMTGAGMFSMASGFDRYEGRAAAGFDRALQYDSTGDDQYETWTDHAQMSGAGHVALAYGFDRFTGYASEGADRSIMHDSTGNDEFRAWPHRAQMRGDSYSAYSYGFDEFLAYATLGHDKAMLFDSPGNDQYHSWADRAQLVGAGYGLYAFGFDRCDAFATTGEDSAILEDSAGDDFFESWAEGARMSGFGYVSQARGFAFMQGVASVGKDRAALHDSAGDDYYRAWTDRVQMKGAGYLAYALNFDETQGLASTGNDRAILYDSAGDDVLVAELWGVELASTAGRRQARGFDYAAAVANSGGSDVKHVGAIDYLFEAIGAWK